MKKIKVLLVNPTAVLAGGTVIANSLAKKLDPEEFEVVCFFPSAGPAVAAFGAASSVRVAVNPMPSWSSTIWRIRRLIAGERFDIVHAHGTRAKFFVWLALSSFRNKPKFIYTVHGFHIAHAPFPMNALLVLCERISNHGVDVVTCVSEGDRNAILKWRTAPAAKVTVVKNGIEMEKFEAPPRAIAEKRAGLGIGDETVLLSNARLHPQKDVSTILKALQPIIARQPAVRLLVVGDGPLRESLEHEAKMLGVSSHAKFLGYRNDIPELLHIADIVILSTNWEGLPLVPLEAGAAKKPIVASDVPGVRETVVDGETGYLFREGNAKDLAEKIMRLIESADLRHRLGERGFEYVRKNFDAQTMVARYAELYRKQKPA